MNTSIGASLPDVSHHRVHVNETELHYVAAGTKGSPILLVHGFPETWWAFRGVIPLLAEAHRVFAVDLRGFGDSANGPGEYDSATSAEDLHQLIETLDVGPVHVVAQDISGGATFRLAALHPDSVRSYTAIEAGLAGFGLEAMADVARGGSWHIGALAAPGIPELLLTGREREFLGQYAFPAMTATPGAITEVDIEEFSRTYSRTDGFRGASGLYRSMLHEGAELTSLATRHPLTMPVLAVGAGAGDFTQNTMNQVASCPVQSVTLDGVGHYVAMEAPAELSEAIVAFLHTIDGGYPSAG